MLPICLQSNFVNTANKEIIVCKPDKGRGVVLMDKAIYLSKITELIADRTKFETISDAPDKYTIKMEDKLNNFLHKIRNCIDIPSDVFKVFFASGSAPGILYGLPKIHKTDFHSKFQFRPIFCSL